MLAADALVQPYLGFDHDARLYAVQALERLHPGLYGNDLYLLYGSQDRYSAFSFLVTPFVAALGVVPAFFVLYLGCKALLFWGTLRLLRALVRDTEAVALGALLLAVVPASFGGNEIFHANEPFLTPRLASSALVLLALERLLARRPVLALCLLVGSFLLHPIMALGGLMTWALYLLSCRLSWRALVGLGILAVGAGAIAVASQPLGNRLFGAFDLEWRDIVFKTCFFIRPSLWTLADWLRIGWGVTVCVAAAVGFARHSGRLLWAVLASAVIGFMGTAVAVHCHYLLLIQASPYRAMWLLEFLAIPLGVAWALDLRRGETIRARTAGLALLPLATLEWTLPIFGWLLVFALPFVLSALYWRGLRRVPFRADWLHAAAGGGLLIGFIVACLYSVFLLLVLCLVKPDPSLNLDLHPLLIAESAPRIMLKLVPLALICGLAALGWRHLGGRVGLALAAVVVALGYQAAICALLHSSRYGQTFSSDYRRMEFVAAHLPERHDDGRPTTIYWPTDVRQIWFDLKANSYFNWVQMSGDVFDRRTAIEGQRRARLVRHFEVAAVSKEPSTPSFWRTAMSNFYEADGPAHTPTVEDLIRLCEDPLLDVVVVEQEFEGLYTATDGKVFIYDCEAIRRRAR
jgi:hypothetical protein